MTVASVYSQTTCLHCGNPIPQPKVGRPRKYCNAACSMDYWRARNPRGTGEGTHFYPKGHTPWNKGLTKDDPRVAENVRKTSDALRGRPMSPERYAKFVTTVRCGPANNKWKGGITADNAKWRQSDEYKAWRIAVYRRDYFTCQRCGIKAHGRGTLVAHHIKSWHEYPDLRFDIDNGITFCRPCHAVEDDWIRNNRRGWTEGTHEPRVKGEKHGNAKLTDADATEVLSLLAQGVRPSVLARRYGVSPATISDLKAGRTWAHLPREVAPAPLFEEGSLTVLPHAG